MIGRYPRRPARRQPQDFHFFAASDPIANLESQFARPPARPPESQPYSRKGEETVKSIAAEGLQLLQNFLQSASAPAAPAEAAHPLMPAPKSAISIQLAAPRTNDVHSKPAARKAAPKSKSAKSRRSCAGKRMKAPRPKTAAPLAQAAPAVSHHDRHCTICSHRDRVDIETEFVNWHSTHHIAYDYKISRSAIYRHAHALGLIAQRNRRLRSALAHLIECAEDVEPTADSIVRAIHAFARINDDGQWVEPPSHVIVSSGGVLSAPPRAGVQGGIRRESGAPNAHRPLAISLDAPMLANVIDVPSGAVLPGTPNRVESDATR